MRQHLPSVLIVFLALMLAPLLAQQVSQSSGTPSAGAPASASQLFSPSASNPLTVVLDPAHGGTDTGARGSTGAIEKNVTLALAQAARNELELQGFHVLMTRQADENPSYDDRATVANIHRNAVFVTFHVSTLGKAGILRTYTYPFWTPPMAVPSPSPTSSPSNAPAEASPAPGLVVWEEAQKPYSDLSRQLANLVQAQIIQSFPGSPSTPSSAAVRNLRSVSAPAIAVEVSSVSAGNEGSLDALGPALAGALTRALAAFQQLQTGRAAVRGN